MFCIIHWHRSEVNKKRIERCYLYEKNKVEFDAPIDTNRLQRQEVRRKYSEQLQKRFEEIKEKEYTDDQEKWNGAVETIIGCGEGILSTKRKVNNNHIRTYDDKIQKLSKEQKKLCLIISSSNCENQIQALKHQRNVVLKKIPKRVNVNRKKEIEEVARGIERLQAANMLQICCTVKDSKTFLCMKNYGKYELNPEEVYKVIKSHFKCQLYEESTESLPAFTGKQKNLDKTITTEEVRQATLKLNYNRAAGTDRILAELDKYTPV